MDFWVDGCHGVKMVDGGEWFGTRDVYLFIFFGMFFFSSWSMDCWKSLENHITKDSYC